MQAAAGTDKSRCTRLQNRLGIASPCAAKSAPSLLRTPPQCPFGRASSKKPKTHLPPHAIPPFNSARRTQTTPLLLPICARAPNGCSRTWPVGGEQPRSNENLVQRRRGCCWCRCARVSGHVCMQPAVVACTASPGWPPFPGNGVACPMFTLGSLRRRRAPASRDSLVRCCRRISLGSMSSCRVLATPAALAGGRWLFTAQLNLKCRPSFNVSLFLLLEGGIYRGDDSKRN